MRILMLSWEYPPHVVGGLGAHVAELLPALARVGVEVHLVTPRWKGGALKQTVPGNVQKRGSSRGKSARASSPPATVYRVPVPRKLTNDFFVDAQETIKNLESQCEVLWKKFGGFDLIHAHDWLVAFAAVDLKRAHKTPLLATIHATERGRGRGFLGGDTAQAINNTEWWLTYEAWRVITTSAFMANEVKNYFQTPSDKVDIVPNGIDVARFDAIDVARLKTFRAKWVADPASSRGTKKDKRIVFFVGRIVHEKGADLIVQAAPRVLQDFPKTKFIIAGTGMLVEGLRKRAVELGIADRVNVTGFISDADRDKLLKVADVAVFPSLYEPFGIVALEAMAAKCPVVVSTVGGLGEVVTHNVNGVTVYPDSVESLAWGILYALNDPNAAKARAKIAYRMVKEDYNWDRIAARTAEIYARIIAERKKTKW